MTDDPLFAEHHRRNLMSQDSWERFSGHRQLVTSLLCDAAAGRADRLCLLGAGNCCDIDLAELLERYAAIQLVDVDLDAMQAGIQRQQLAADPRLEPLRCDVTGLGHLLSQLSPATADDDPVLLNCLRLAHELLAGGPVGPFDVAASLCLLTQLVDSVVLTLDEQHARFAELVLAVRNAHLRLLVQLARPGGAAIVITDVVSSETCQELPNVPAAMLPDFVSKLIGQRNFFTGANPFALRAFLQTDPHTGPLLADVEIPHPWLWDFGPRVYAVAAVVARRR